jgi:hypothetical protein
LFHKCDEFQFPRSLRNFTIVYGIAWIGDECVEPAERINHDDLMAKLLTKGQTQSKPALLDLLDALVNRYKEEGSPGKDFKALKEKILNALIEAEKAEQPRVYEALVQVSGSSESPGENDLAKQWIEEAGGNLDELALRVTLAVFHGTTFELIERAKNDLLERLQELVPPPPRPSEGSPPPGNHVPLMRRIELAGAKEIPGKAPDWRKVIELNRPEAASRAISYFWQLYRESKWRQKVIEWLTEYASGYVVDVRTRVAVAAGRLAVDDYRFVRDNLLAVWVKQNDAEYRMAVGMALGVLVREENWASEVQELLWKWSKSSELDERWAAVRAYIYVGAYLSTSEVIARWQDIASSELVGVYVEVSEDNVLLLRNPLYMSLMDAMMRFFVETAQRPIEEKRRLFTGILAGLRAWMTANKGDPGLGIFMFSTLSRLVANPLESESADGPPVLFELIDDTQSDYQAELLQLFNLLMSNGNTIVEAKDLLCRWVSWINALKSDSQAPEKRLQNLLRNIIAADTSGRMRGKLTLCLRDCGRKAVVERILSDL